jgi:hypothetical protein
MLALPPAIQPAHRTALEALAADLRTEFDDRFVGLVIGGSVGAGTASPSSDIDAFVLVDVPWRQRRRRTVAGVAVDLFLDPPEQVMRAIVRERAAVLIENYAAGWIAYDPMGRAQALCAQARPRFARGRRPLNPAERFTSRLRCARRARSARRRLCKCAARVRCRRDLLSRSRPMGSAAETPDGRTRTHGSRLCGCAALASAIAVRRPHPAWRRSKPDRAALRRRSRGGE